MRSRLLIVACAVIVLCAVSTPLASQPLTVAYLFPQNAILQPGQVDPMALNRVNYAFANIKGGRMVAGFANDAVNLPYLTSLRKRNASLTILISVGGWLWSTDFSEMSRTKASRSAFIQSAIKFIKQNDLDGLDIDWEYPGMPGAGHPYRDDDKNNFTHLLKETREAFDRETRKNGRKLFLTIAAGASDEYLAHTEMAKVQKYVDTVNLMSYDYYEAGAGPITGHHAPLFANPVDPIKASADASVHAFERAGVPAEKILLGIPFYGRAWGEVADVQHGLFQPGKPVPNSFVSFSAITSTMLDHGYSRFWDPSASVPYLYNAQAHVFVSYEDEQSITAKCNYVIAHGLGGVMFWEYTEDPSGKLLGTIDSTLRFNATDNSKPQ